LPQRRQLAVLSLKIMVRTLVTLFETILQLGMRSEMLSDKNTFRGLHSADNDGNLDSDTDGSGRNNVI